jgi:hypothetical protein
MISDKALAQNLVEIYGYTASQAARVVDKSSDSEKLDLIDLVEYHNFQKRQRGIL